MRIAYAGFSQETNFFGNVTVSREVMDAKTQELQQVMDINRGLRSYVGAILEVVEEEGGQIVPIRHLPLPPSGPCDRAGFEHTVKRTVELLVAAYEKEPFDGITMFMHGGCAVEGYPDPEGTILDAIREKLGKDLPIGLVLDLHGNISQRMVDNTTMLMGCKEYPHIDAYEEGRIMAKLLVDKIKGGYPVYQRLVKLPWLMVPTEGVTTTPGPAKDVHDLCMAREQEDPDLLQLSFFQGFPYADSEDCSVSFIAVAKTQECADRHALEVARYAWNRRKDFTVPRHSAEEAIELALAMGEGPIIVNDSSDNPGSGCPGDGTYLLRALLEKNVNSAFAFIRDPEVVQQAIKAGVGATIDCRLGGKTDKFHGEPIELKGAYVKCISDGITIRQSLVGFGVANNIGMVVGLKVGNVEIAVSSLRNQTFDEGPFINAGITWRNKQIVALKSAQHFKGWWADKVNGIVTCDAPGLGSADLTIFDFKRTNTTYYPLQDAQWNG